MTPLFLGLPEVKSPWVPWLLLLVPVLLVFYIWASHRSRSTAMRFTNTAILGAVMSKQPQWKRHIAVAAALLCVATTTVAWARPMGIEQVPRNRATIVVAIDSSLSMKADDVSPTRLAAAKAKAKEKGLNYVKLDGEVGVIGNGAGLVMSTLDVVAYAGEEHGGVKPANFLDIGGGANAEVMANGLDVILGDEQVKSVFVNVFGGITACDAVADGIVGALKTLGDSASKPLVVRLDGNNVEEGRRILDEANHPLVTSVDTMDGGAAKVAEAAAAGK